MTVPWDFRSRTWPHSLLGPHFAHSVIAAHNCYVMGEMRSQVTQVSPTPAPPPHRTLTEDRALLRAWQQPSLCLSTEEW